MAEGLFAVRVMVVMLAVVQHFDGEAIEPHEVRLGQLMRRAMAEERAVHTRDVVGLAHDCADVVGDDQDGDAVLAELAEQHVDIFPALNVHARDGLVHHEQVGSADEGAGDEGALPLAGGELADAPALEVCHVNDLQDSVHGRAVALAPECERREAGVLPVRDNLADRDGEHGMDACGNLRDVADAAPFLELLDVGS